MRFRCGHVQLRAAGFDPAQRIRVMAERESAPGWPNPQLRRIRRANEAAGVPQGIYSHFFSYICGSILLDYLLRQDAQNSFSYRSVFSQHIARLRVCNNRTDIRKCVV